MVRRAQVQVSQLSLAVGQRLGNSIQEDLDPAHAEVVAEESGTANGDPLIEGEVVAVRHEDARHVGQRLVEAPGGFGAADLRLVHQLNGVRRLGEREGAAGGGNGDRGQDDLGRSGVGLLGAGDGRPHQRPQSEGPEAHRGTLNNRFQRIRNGSRSTLK